MDVEKTVEFLVNQQAQLHVEQQRQAENHTRLQELVHNLVGVVSQLATEQRQFQKEVRQSQKELRQSLKELSQAQIKTEEKLRALIQVVRRNGRRRP